MPPKTKLPAEEIATLTKWVEMGAPWPPEQPAGPTAYEKPFDLQQRKAAHWAWQPISAPEPPPIKNDAWPASNIDRFILSRLETEGISPAVNADRHAFIRRVYFDLIGLPPPPEAVEQFVSDSSPQALESLVDRLLASPRFGERWARHWLDLVRYAETFGHEFDYPIEHAWQYRDYVIRALNADVPYDQFITEQIAGDLLPEPRLHPTENFNESIIGTGFWFFRRASACPGGCTATRGGARRQPDRRVG